MHVMGYLPYQNACILTVQMARVCLPLFFKWPFFLTIYKVSVLLFYFYMLPGLTSLVGETVFS